jgi:sporulation protein YlmC with PRC-barrel domain
MKYSNDNETGVNHEGLFPNQPLKYLSASSIIGDKVYNDKEENLGEIKDIMLDIVSGSIQYYVMESGGFLGIGIKYFAIPFNLLKVDEVKKHFRFNCQKEQLQKAPGFDIDHWPDTNIHLEEVNSYWSFMGNDEGF